MIAVATILLALFAALTAERRITQVSNISKEVHRMYNDRLPEWFSKALELPCGAPGPDFTGSYWLFNEQPTFYTGLSVEFSRLIIHNPSVNSSGTYDCCLPNNSADDECYRTTLNITEGRSQVEVDVRLTNNSSGIAKRLPLGVDIYLWVFHDQGALDRCEFDNGQNAEKSKFPPNANIQHVESPFGLAFNNFVIYEASEQNSGVYTCFTPENSTNTFELIFGEKHDRPKTAARPLLKHYFTIAVVFLALHIL